jgi:hypothetical protein
MYIATLAKSSSSGLAETSSFSNHDEPPELLLLSPSSEIIAIGSSYYRINELL